MFSGAETEWLPTLKVSWHVPHVPSKGCEIEGGSPSTPFMCNGVELNSVWPRRILARAALVPLSLAASTHNWLNNVKTIGVNDLGVQSFGAKLLLMPIQ